jgi:ryanodine receptor 2
MYAPQPIDTSRVELPASLEPLVEKLAEHVHDVWAQRRIDQGWSWGEKRDDLQKKHPCLVPYNQLAESEKQFDRNTALATLKAVVALGYRIRQD